MNDYSCKTHIIGLTSLQLMHVKFTQNKRLIISNKLLKYIIGSVLLDECFTYNKLLININKVSTYSRVLKTYG